MQNWHLIQRTKGTRVNSPYWHHCKSNSARVIFRHGIQFFQGCHARWMNVFLEDEPLKLSTYARAQNRGAGLAFIRRSGISKNREYSKG